MLRILHGTWIPDGLFVFMEERQQVLPVGKWMRDVFNAEAGPWTEHVLLDSREFHTPNCSSDGPSTRTEALSTQVLEGVVVPIAHMFVFLLGMGDVSHEAHGGGVEDYTKLLVRWRMDDARVDEPVRMADDLRFWRRVTLLALELLMRGRITPTLQKVPSPKHNQVYGYSVWVPFLKDENDMNRFNQLVEAMPPFCRSYHPTHGQGWMDVPPADIVLSFLSWGMDSWIRGAVTDEHHLVLEHAFAGSAEPAAGPANGQRSLAMTWMTELLRVDRPSPFSARKRDVDSLANQVDVWTGRLLPFMPATRSGTPEGSEYTEDTAVETIATEQPARLGRLRLCLRLDTTHTEWALEFLLKSVEDPSLLISAEEVWQSRSPYKELLGWRFAGVQETLLAELGRSARIYPAILQPLNESLPTRLPLDVHAAHRFLTETVERLEASGISVLLPTWWTTKGRKRLGIKMRVQPSIDISWDDSGVSHLGLHRLVQFDACAAIGDEEVTLSELEEIASLKQPFVQFRGLWTEVNPAELAQMVEYLKSGAQGQMELGTLMQMAVRHTVSDQWADDVDRDGSKNIGPIVDFELPEDIRALMEGRVETPDIGVPVTLCGELRPYQRRGFQWLVAMTKLGFGVCLADDMGLGKTVQAITLLLHAAGARQSRDTLDGQTALVLCPTSLLGNWQREFERFAPSLRVYVQHGTNRPHGRDFAVLAQEADVVVSTYQLAHRDFDDFATCRWSHLILDEAQNIKNSDSKQSRSIVRMKANTRIAMTGTPVENRLDELWSLFQFLNAGYLGSAEKFRTRFAVPIERDGDSNKAEILQKLVAPFILRRVKTDATIIPDLPDKIEMKTYCPLTREQASLYQAAVNDMLFRLESAIGMERRGIILGGLTKLKQICNHPVHFLRDGGGLSGRSGKLNRLLELLTQIREARESVLVFTQYAEMGELLVQSILQEFNESALFLHGGLSKRKRDEMVQLFQSDWGPNVFVLSLKAGGVGLNLTRANHVIHYDRWWNPAVENQATDRAFRIGQRRNVEVHKFICQGTLEDNIDTLIESKRALADQIVGTGETWLSEMSNLELASLLTLRHHMIEEEVG